MTAHERSVGDALRARRKAWREADPFSDTRVVIDDAVRDALPALARVLDAADALRDATVRGEYDVLYVDRYDAALRELRKALEG